MCYDATDMGDDLLFSHQVFRFTCIKLGKAPLLWGMDFLAASELEHDLMQGFHHMLLLPSLAHRDMMT